jgi:hypothetical protein
MASCDVVVSIHIIEHLGCLGEHTGIASDTLFTSATVLPVRPETWASFAALSYFTMATLGIGIGLSGRKEHGGRWTGMGVEDASASGYSVPCNTTTFQLLSELPNCITLAIL